MNSKALLFVSCLASLGAAASAQAATTALTGKNAWYTGLAGDLTWPNHADLGGGGKVALGYRFASAGTGNVRLEGEAGYHSANGADGYGDVRYFNYMGNVYYDFANMKHDVIDSGWYVTPYIGGGAGMASIRIGHGSFASTFHNHTNSFAYQGMAGLSFASAEAPNAEWVLGYRYMGTNREEGIKLHSNNIELGLRYHF